MLRQFERTSTGKITKKHRIKEFEFEKVEKSILSNRETFEKIKFTKGYKGIAFAVKGGNYLTWWEKEEEED